MYNNNGKAKEQKDDWIDSNDGRHAMGILLEARVIGNWGANDDDA